MKNSVIIRPPSKPTLYQQIASNIRSVIKKDISPGHMLASERNLAKHYSTSPMTIRKALDLLVDEGLVERKHRLGYIVTDPLAQGEFAIVTRQKVILGEWISPFYRMTAQLISEKIYEYNKNWCSNLHLGRDGAGAVGFQHSLDLLDPDVVKRLLGVFAFFGIDELAERLQQKNIPIVGLDRNYGSDFCVFLDKDLFIRESVRHLRQAGCKTVGLFGATDLSKIFTKYAIEAGLSVQEKWLPFHGKATENNAYELFMDFWEQQDNHPDGMIISDEVLAFGVLRAVLHKQIHLPDQLRLISHSNIGVEFPYHFPVTRYEYDLNQIATAAVDGMIKLVKGQKVKGVSIPGKLVKGETT